MKAHISIMQTIKICGQKNNLNNCTQLVLIKFMGEAYGMKPGEYEE